MKKLIQLCFSVLLITFSFELFAQPVIANNTSGPAVCDGFAFFTDSTVLSSSIYWTGSGAVLQQGEYYFAGLCAGTYTVNYTDSSGGTLMYTFIIEDGNPCDSFMAIMSTTTTDSTSSTFCDGSATVQVYGGTAPYSYSWSNVSTVGSSTIGNLCSGNYFCVVADANGCIYTASGYIVDSTSISPSDTTIIIDNSSPNDSLIIDTLGYSWIYDCMVDLGSIDSAYIIDNIYSGADSVIITWILIDSTGTAVSTYSVGYATGGVTGVVLAYLTIACPIKSLNINSLIASDQLYLGTSSAGFNVDNEEIFKVINPFNDELIIQFENAKNRTMQLVDLNGKLMIQADSNLSNCSLDTRFLNAGMYLLIINDGLNPRQIKLVK
jgi:hypothetical protein